MDRPKDITIRRVDELPEMYRGVFPFETFNAIQSSVFDQVMKSDKNIMLSAPTGCGKTVVAELAMISAVMKYNYPTLMLYVSPLRALCQEKVRDWTERLNKCGIAVQEYTGDSNNQMPTNLQTHLLLCTTPEKIDLATRNWKQRSDIFMHVSVVIIDEVHTIGDSRGAVLEAMITRLLLISDNSQSLGGIPIRVVALSATVPNYQDIAKWIKAEDPEKTRFDDSFRSTPITSHVFGYRSCVNDWMFESSLTSKISAIIRQYSQGKPTLIFCCTRKSCEKTANQLLIDIPNLHGTKANVHDKTLADLLSRGIGFHTAGLSSDDREIVEDLFIRGEITILCATSTLAQGINLPAALVIIKGTKHYSDGYLNDYDHAQLLQMMGRAGRPQFHDKGICVIMTETKCIKEFESIVNNSRPVESCLLSALTEHINAEIALETIKNIDDAIKWIKTTFLYTRLPQNPLYYKVKNLLGVEDFLMKHCNEAIGNLEKWGFINVEDGCYFIQPTGALCSKYGLQVGTMRLYSESFPILNLETALNVLCKAEEFNDIVVRQEDRQKMRLMAADSSLRFPSVSIDDPSFFTSQNKCFLMIQIALSKGKIEDWSLAQEYNKIKRTADRMLMALYLLAVEKKELKSSFFSLLLMKCIFAGMWETEKQRLTQQVKGIGEVNAKKLFSAGLTDFDKLRDSHVRFIERATNHRPGWGTTIAESISRLPFYSIEVLSSPEKIQVIVTNQSSKDPTFGHHGVEILVGMDNYLLTRKHYRVTAHQTMSMFCNIGILNPNDIEVYVVDREIVGVDLIQKGLIKKQQPTITDILQKTSIVPPTSQTRVVDIPDQSEIVVWQMKANKAIETISTTEGEARNEGMMSVQESKNEEMNEPSPPVQTSFISSDDEHWERFQFDDL
ncbi:DEAD/DEAH box helicase family protein [Trichomonas vaginalis G3]|uniref:DNA 3'-5' helicase n=1 Tax=Trichomonas vaginalis (strain ATCC PRA-98 / G3) TaxID=412133 RepID=A2DQY6_TRIV3|nr:helicase MER3 [Trichomonas vaginalis G3]EAY17253.1 DEAD/DEAH box helicase family protein [Trichomonas vaginalis G3]KAI5486216.1 helicase MER3 [Trichomonas vaginalis G3]|eukprot:XP_001329476.1 DEAD/DEAH box helicase family protein [Trichomonas vaginalis G3]